MDYAKEQFVELGVALTGLAVKGTASTKQKKKKSFHCFPKIQI